VSGLVPGFSLDLANEIVVSLSSTVGYEMCECAHGPESRLLALRCLAIKLSEARDVDIAISGLIEEIEIMIQIWRTRID